MDASASSIGVDAAKDRARLRFLLSLSHELRTPLGIITGYLSLLHAGEISTERALEVVNVKAQELSAVVDALLAMAEEELAGQERWLTRSARAREESDRLRNQNAAVIARARKLSSDLSGLDHSVEPRRERRDFSSRSARDELALRTGMAPRTFGSLTGDAARALLDQLERRATS